MRLLLLSSLFLLACAGTTDTPADAGCVPEGTGCVKSCDPGNKNHIGEYCTKNGNECGDNGFGNAVICTADQSDVEEGLGFCTWPCDYNSECGEGAICTGETPTSPLKGCFPTKCDPTNPGVPDPVDAGM